MNAIIIQGSALGLVEYVLTASDLHHTAPANVLCEYADNTYLLVPAGRGGLVVGRATAVREDPGSNLTAAGHVYHNSHCDIQPWARIVHDYCSA